MPAFAPTTYSQQEYSAKGQYMYREHKANSSTAYSSSVVTVRYSYLHYRYRLDLYSAGILVLVRREQQLGSNVRTACV